MEKLRKRYRSELNRAKSIPHHRFSSSWVYFPKIDSMEKGPHCANSVSPSSPPHATVVATAHDDVDDPDDDDDDDDSTVGGGYGFRNFDYQKNGLRIKIAGNLGSPNPNPNPNFGYKSKYANINNFSSPPPPPQFEDGVKYARVMKNGSNCSAGSSGLNMNTTMRMKKKGTELGKREREISGNDAAMEMVEAIRLMGEGFVRMEKMKMEMMRETERMRMEMEMKRTEMILESQHRIVEAFAKSLSDTMKKKKDASC